MRSLRFFESSWQIASKTLFTSSVCSVFSHERKDSANPKLLESSATPLPSYESKMDRLSSSKDAPLSFCLAILVISLAISEACSFLPTIMAMSRTAGGNGLKGLNFSAFFLRPATSGLNDISPARTILSIPRSRRCATLTAPNFAQNPSRRLQGPTASRRRFSLQ